MISMAGKAIRKWWALFALPTFAAFIIGFVIPFIMGVYLSFCKFTTVTDSEFIGLKNYQKALADKEFLHALGFSTALTIVTTVVINVVAFAIAYMLTKAIKGSTIFRSVFFMPNLIGGIVLGYIWNLIINGVLAIFGVDITFKAEYGFWGLVILTNWQLIGYMMVIYIAGLQNIPRDLNEAAEIDGASHGQILRKITIPMVMPSVTICTFLTLTNSFKLFDQNLALTNGSPQIPGTNIYKTEMLALHIFKTNGIGNNFCQPQPLSPLCSLRSQAEGRCSHEKEQGGNVHSADISFRSFPVPYLCGVPKFVQDQIQHHGKPLQLSYCRHLCRT